MSYFSAQDGLKYHLEGRWEHKSQVDSQSADETIREFPVHKVQLIERYRELESLLNRDWHPNATLGAAISGDGLLTDHGVEHVNAVMQHAQMLIGKNINRIYGYEIYLFLLAVHFHDLGNIYGREEHESKIDEVIEKLDDNLPLDIVEKQFVIAIAKAHGGFCNEDKDTIRYINVDETCNGVPVRAKVLAALLRFADEISDDFSRAAYKGIKIPRENEIFHAYSETLEPISIQGETIKYHFRIPYEYTQRKLGKGTKSVYLYDEILSRLAKCMRELEYCRKYANGFLNITALSVSIDILQKDSLLKVKDRMGFRLKLLGYPDEKVVKIDAFWDNDSCDTNSTGADSMPKYRTGSALKKAMNERRAGK